MLTRQHPLCEEIGCDVSVVTFEGKMVPCHIYGNDQVMPVREDDSRLSPLWDTGLTSARGHRRDEGPAEHECTPRCLICGGSHLTGAAPCRDKYWKPIKPKLPQSNTK
ncbi:hypothetical protein HPB50_020188 [Hyalomma asiaticum]|uniref:Uncharacterized protein n=1 Tax=Hyalomma asiaticum TaxID=266040 RepID=A0ACB7TKB2_HYAAI|nr:hypothetical protein HPB50_020188 [Hyalomma asiaticum]